MTGLSDAMLERHAQTVIIDAIGEAGQVKLLNSHVLVIGAGGLGSAILYYLAATGIGKITLLDDELVTLSNLQRQIIYNSNDLSRSKALVASEKIAQLNPDIKVQAHKTRLTPENALHYVQECDIAVDASDNYPARQSLNEACFKAEKTMVSASLSRFEGQISVWKPGIRDGATGLVFPCYQCIFPEDPTPSHISRCDQVGILSPVAGIIGSFQACETLKELLTLKPSLAGQLLLFDARYSKLHSITIQRRTGCPICDSGDNSAEKATGQE